MVSIVLMTEPLNGSLVTRGQVFFCFWCCGCGPVLVPGN
jgi:hypothetical protein